MSLDKWQSGVKPVKHYFNHLLKIPKFSLTFSLPFPEVQISFLFSTLDKKNPT